MKKVIFLATLTLLLTNCSDKPTDNNATKEIIKTKDNNTQFLLDYRPNGKAKSVTVTNSDSTQNVLILFDSTGLVRATVVKKNGVRTHAIEYFENGRPRGLTNFDSTFTGDATYYYDNGNKKSEGRWTNGHETGAWKSYNDKGDLIKTDTL